MIVFSVTVDLIKKNWRVVPAQSKRAGFRNFFGGKLCIARARRSRPGLKVYPPWIQIRDVADFVMQ